MAVKQEKYCGIELLFLFDLLELFENKKSESAQSGT